MSFQRSLNRDLPRGVAGDFSSTNPRHSMLAGEASLRSNGPVTVGQFAFADLATGRVTTTWAAGLVTGFVHRNNQAIVALGSSASMIIPTGREITLFTDGDFYAVAPANVNAGDAVYSLDATGALSAVAADSHATNFKFAENAVSGALVKITRFSI
jgi:hypothetical protein